MAVPIALLRAQEAKPYPAFASVAKPAPSAIRERPSQPAFPRMGPLAIGGVTYYPYRFEGHVHTSHSPDARHPTLSILEAAERVGLDALVITDHGASKAYNEFGDYHGRLVPFVGREIGGNFGHAVFWNVIQDEHQVPSRTSLQQRANFAHQHGGLLVFAHPGWWIHGNDQNPMLWMTPNALRRGGSAGDVDAIELWNGVYYPPLPKLIASWVKLLEAGVYVPIVGNSDFHRFAFHQLGNSHNIALCDRADVQTCLWPAVKQGRIIVSDGPAAVVSVNGQLPGSILQNDPAKLDIAVDALAPEGGTLQVYLGREIVQRLPLQPGVRAQANWQIPAPAADSFVRIDVLRAQPNPERPKIAVLSNPILIDRSPLRSSWR